MDNGQWRHIWKEQWRQIWKEPLAFNKTPPGTTTTEYHETKRIRTKGCIIFLNCQNGKSKSGWQHEKNQDKKKHHLLANNLCHNGKDESHPLANQTAKWQIQIRLATQKESGQKEVSSSCESSLPKRQR
jgi:hypothetical protein